MNKFKKQIMIEENYRNAFDTKGIMSLIQYVLIFVIKITSEYILTNI